MLTSARMQRSKSLSAMKKRPVKPTTPASATHVHFDNEASSKTALFVEFLAGKKAFKEPLCCKKTTQGKSREQETAMYKKKALASQLGRRNDTELKMRKNNWDRQKQQLNFSPITTLRPAINVTA